MFLLTLSVVFFWIAAGTAMVPDTSPTVRVRNGTYVGLHSSTYHQDLFLGMPYAQQPIGNLRFTTPQPLNESWDGVRQAKRYSDICVGYGSDSIWYPQSEACLTLNVIRDSSVISRRKVPVAVWIHGGGFYMGSGADQRYNMSAIVKNASKIGKPFIAVTLNYRLSAWGFISSSEVQGSGNTNLGLRDQRLALQWVQENIAAFGGDPKQVTIWGESAGAISVGHHLTAYGGRDDKLFRAGIMQSGASVSANAVNRTTFQSTYDDLIFKVNCSNTIDSLQCLREVPFEVLNSVLNGTDGTSQYNFWPTLDGDMVRNWGSVQLDKGQFVKVPIITGTNSDEGTAFGPVGINTTREFYEYLTDGDLGFHTPPHIAQKILQLYPDDPSQGIPGFLGNHRVPSMGWQWRRTSSFAGDFTMHANRRKQCQVWSKASTTVYSYRFNAHASDVPTFLGATHFEEVAFVFNNIDGLGYHGTKPFDKLPRSYIHLSSMMASMWASFIHDLNPNHGLSDGRVYWNAYHAKKPANLFFDANTTTRMEEDSWHEDQIAYINEAARVFWR